MFSANEKGMPKIAVKLNVIVYKVLHYRFETIAPLYYRNATAVIVVYDVSRRLSFTHDLKKWIGQLKNNCNLNNIVLVVVGNKVDKDASLREVDQAEGKKYAESLGAPHWETSAKTGLNIEEVFAYICSKVDEDETIRMKLTTKVPLSRQLTVRSPDGRTVEASKKSHCCN